MVVDDVHWADESAVTLLVEIVDAGIPSVRWVFAARRGDLWSAPRRLLAELERRVEVRHVTLGALTDDDLGELVARCSNPRSMRPGVTFWCSDVMAATGGHPLVATELIAHRVASPDHDDDPPRLDAIVAEMLSGLATSERRRHRDAVGGRRRMPDRADRRGTSGRCHIGARLGRAPGGRRTGRPGDRRSAAVPTRPDQACGRHARYRSPIAVARRCSLIAQLSRDPRFVVATCRPVPPARRSPRRRRTGRPRPRRRPPRSTSCCGGSTTPGRGASLSAISTRSTVSTRLTGRPQTLRPGLAARLKAVTALIAFGEVDRGRDVAHAAHRSSRCAAVTHERSPTRCSPWGRSRPEDGTAPSSRRRRSGSRWHYRTTNTSAAPSFCAGRPTTSASVATVSEALRVLEAADKIVAARPTPRCRVSRWPCEPRWSRSSEAISDVSVRSCQSWPMWPSTQVTRRARRRPACSPWGWRSSSARSTTYGRVADDLMEMAERFPRQDLRWWPLRSTAASRSRPASSTPPSERSSPPRETGRHGDWRSRRGSRCSSGRS